MSLFTFQVNTQMAERQFSQLQQTLERILSTMAINAENFNAALARIQDDVLQVGTLVNELKNRPDNSAEAQAVLDEATAKLDAIDAAFDAITAPAAPSEPAPVEPAPEA